MVLKIIPQLSLLVCNLVCSYDAMRRSVAQRHWSIVSEGSTCFAYASFSLGDLSTKTWFGEASSAPIDLCATYSNFSDTKLRAAPSLETENLYLSLYAWVCVCVGGGGGHNSMFLSPVRRETFNGRTKRSRRTLGHAEKEMC